MNRIGVVAVSLAWAAVAAADPPAEPRVNPVADPAKAICIIENPDVKATFLAAYKEELEARGLKVAVLKQPDNFYDCPMTSTYWALWGADSIIGFIYTVDYIRLNVYRDGRLAGYAKYERPNGYVINKADNKVKELVAALFPQG